MITAVDTNILLDILVPNEQFYEASADALCRKRLAKAHSSSAISFMRNFAFISKRSGRAMLESNEIRVQALIREAHFLASRAWLTYRQQGGKRTGILADFLIGAHAQMQATRLLSRDRGFYRKLFPSLDVHDPARVNKGT